MQERRKYGMSNRRVLESEKEEDDFQSTKKRCTELSAPKQHSKLKQYHCKSISKGYVPKIPTTQWAVSTYNGLCLAGNQCTCSAPGTKS